MRSAGRAPALLLGTLLAVASPFLSAQEQGLTIKKEQAVTAKKVEEVLAKYLGENKENWHVYETPNFLLYCREHDMGTAHQVAKTLETSRKQTREKWLKTLLDKEEPLPAKCEVLLFLDTDHYTNHTGVPGNVPGHSSVERNVGGRIVSARMSLQKGLKEVSWEKVIGNIVPHETNHIGILAAFPDRHPPRWYDEGSSVLSEKDTAVWQDRLKQARRDEKLFPLREIIEMKDYPHPSRTTAFYAQSISITAFLAKKKNPHTVTKFVQEGARKGEWLEAACNHFEANSWESLENEWKIFAFQKAGTVLPGQ